MESQKKLDIIKALQGYKADAEDGRRERDIVWKSNWDAYWQRYDFSKKLADQFKVVMPEAPQFVERFAAALKEALVRSGDWFEVEGPPGFDEQLAPFVKGVIKYWLERAGDYLPDAAKDFTAVFEECAKDGALMMMACSVTWEEIDKTTMEVVQEATYDTDPGLGEVIQSAPQMARVVRKCGHIAIKPLDPRTIWFDSTGRKLFRRQRIEIDLHELKKMAEQRDERGDLIWDVEEINRLTEQRDEVREIERRESSNQQQLVGSSGRKPIVLDEWLGTVVNSQGEVLVDNELVVIANEEYLVRGPELNPYLHGQDWVVATPIIRLRGAPYGRSYMETWTPLISAFTEFTNLILDAGYKQAILAHVLNPDAFRDPSQLENGILAGGTYQLEDGRTLDEAIAELELGKLDDTVLGLWRAIKAEAQEGAVLNDLLLGNLPARGERTATEIQQASQSGNAFISSIASSIEHNFLEPILNRIWAISLQHMDASQHPELRDYIPAHLQLILDMPFTDRLALFNGPMQFKASGISGVLVRELKRNQLLAAWQAIMSSRDMAQYMIPRLNMPNLVNMFFRGFEIDPAQLLLPEEQVQANLQAQAEQAAMMAQAEAAGQPQPQPQGGPNAQPVQ